MKTVRELINDLQALPDDYRIAVQGVHATGEVYEGEVEFSVYDATEKYPGFITIVAGRDVR